ncbi:uncharacterized protein ARMOST_02267 [Armillaria ostoyae]|uniref:Uncharacterized protein n=1 Tax=Armillaria ostoyae TaxID=47428 RepID=A0A284QRA2_ARMOS|nr:uncharacterized protein ARMOST_02267 [Armillaria ostoyae]
MAIDKFRPTLLVIHDLPRTTIFHRQFEGTY